jgi:hypothetical protein
MQYEFKRLIYIYCAIPHPQHVVSFAKISYFSKIPLINYNSIKFFSEFSKRAEVVLMRSRCSGAIRARGEVWWMVDATMREEFSTFSMGFMLSCAQTINKKNKIVKIGNRRYLHNSVNDVLIETMSGGNDDV